MALLAARTLLAPVAAFAEPIGAAGREVSKKGGTAGAQPAESPYRALVKTAISEMELGNYPEAHSLFLRAHAMAPSARTLRGLGLTLFEMRRYVEAERQLAAALSSKERPLEGQVRASTQSLHDRARQYIGTLWLSPTPSTATVLVDQAPVGDTRPLRLNAGEHMLELRAPGFATERRRLSIAGGQAQRLSIALTPLRVSDAAYTAETRAPHREGGSLWSSPWLWAGAGLVAAGLVVVGVVVLGGDPDPVETGRYDGSTGARLAGP